MDPVEKRRLQEKVSECVKFITENIEHLNDEHLTELSSTIRYYKQDKIEKYKEEGIIKFEEDIQKEIERIKDGRDFDLTYEYVDDEPGNIFLPEPNGESPGGLVGIEEEKAFRLLQSIPTGISEEEILKIFESVF